MDLWERTNWKQIIDNTKWRTGIRFRFDKGINPEIKESVLRYAFWLRKQFLFPVRVPVYIKRSEKLIARDGDDVYGLFRFSDNYDAEPYIKIAVGEYEKDIIKSGRDNALAAILHSISHELSHYYQWINGMMDLPERSVERQAVYFASKRIREYASYVDHP